MHKLPEYAALMLQGDLYGGDKNIPVSGTASVAGKQKDFSTRQTLMLDAPRAFREDLAAEASLGHIWQTLDYARPGLPASRQDLHSLTAVNRWAWYPVPWLSLRVSGDYRYLTLDSTDMGGHYRHEGGLALSVEYAPGAGLLIIPSIKAAINGAATNGAAINGAPEAVLIAGALPVVPVPKFGLVWTAGNFSLKNNYFRSFKYPDFEDLYWIGEGTTGNPRLRPEDGWGGDLIAAYFFNRDTNLEGSFFAQWTQDSIHWYNSNGTWQPENVGAAAFFGLDAKFRGKIPLDRGPFTAIGFSLSYQYLLSYLLSYGYTFASDKRIPYMPAHTLGFSADLSWESGALILEGHFESLRYGETANLVRLAPCFLLDLRVNQKIGKTFSVFGALRNALNTSYESLSGYPMPGISLTLGVQINFEKEP
jgi:vitamin B12 transporter